MDVQSSTTRLETSASDMAVLQASNTSKVTRPVLESAVLKTTLSSMESADKSAALSITDFKTTSASAHHAEPVSNSKAMFASEKVVQTTSPYITRLALELHAQKEKLSSKEFAYPNVQKVTRSKVTTASSPAATLVSL